MAVDTIHKLDKIVLPSTVVFSGIRSSRWNAGIESLLERPAGHPHPMFRANLSQKPVLEFTTWELDVLLGAIGVGGASLGSTATYFKKGAVTGNDARASTTHQKITITASCAYWSTIRLTHNGVSEATVMLTAVYDGTNNPFIYAGSQALSGNLSAGNFFGAGPVSINGTAITGIKEITIDSGVRLIQEGASSELWDTFVGIEQTAPRVTIRTLKMTNWASLGLTGTVLDGTNGLVFYARKFSPQGRVADGTAEHIKFIGLTGSAIPVDTNGEGSGPISDTLVCELTSGSDSIVPLTGTLLSAIS